ncbi:MAG: DNA glycosylase [Clostridia bacterium]
MVIDGLKNFTYDLVIETKCFNLYDTLECGQCFRWKNINFCDRNNSEFIGVICDRVVKIKQIDKKLYISSNNKNDLEDVINYYFDLYNNYSKIENYILKIDSNIKKAVNNSSGIHILNQDPFETLISFIISANNNIPRIKKSIEEISKRYGKKVIFENNEYYLFPTINELKNVSIDDFKLCSVGFRDKYIVKTISDIIDRDISFICLSKLTNSQLKTVLMSFAGVGPKVADCVMLFSFGRQDVFPIDVWIKRVMEKLYFKKEVSIKLINEYQVANFSSYSGIIQQHLFYNVRNQEI